MYMYVHVISMYMFMCVIRVGETSSASVFANLALTFRTRDHQLCNRTCASYMYSIQRCLYMHWHGFTNFGMLLDMIRTYIHTYICTYIHVACTCKDSSKISFGESHESVCLA